MSPRSKVQLLLKFLRYLNWARAAHPGRLETLLDSCLNWVRNLRHPPIGLLQQSLKETRNLAKIHPRYLNIQAKGRSVR